MKKRIILWATVILAAVSLAGCGKKEKESSGETGTASKDYVYRMEDLEIEAARQMTRVGEDIYAYGIDWADEGDSTLYIYKLNTDGAVTETHSIPVKQSISFRNINLDDEANIYCIENDFHMIGGDAEAGDDGAAAEPEPAAIEPRTVDSDVQDTETEDNDTEGTGTENAGAEESGAQDVDTEESGMEESDAEDTENGSGEEADTADETDTEDTADVEDADYEEKYGSEEEEYADDYYLTKMTLDGEKIFSVKLNDIPEFAELAEENGYFSVGDMVLKKGEGIYINSYSTFYKFDLEGNFIKASGKVDDENQELLDRSSFITLADGRVIAVYNDDQGMTAAFVNLDTGTFEESYALELPGVSYDFSFYAGTGYDLYLVDSYALYGYNLGDAEKTCLMKYIDSDLDLYNIYQVMGINEKEFFAMYDDMETGESVLAKFTKVPPEEVKEKQELTLAMGFTDWRIRRSVIAFNKKSEDYRITILDYYTMYNGDGEDYMAGVNRLNTDIATGKIPDIILLDETMPVDSYISKGLLEDVKPFIEKDPELDINNYMPNVIEALSVKGKLYTIVPSYTIQTVLAKTSEVGPERGWTVQEALELLASKPEGTMLFEQTTRSSMLQSCLNMAGEQFIDWETGTCSFDTDSFIQTLELLSLFPEEIKDDYYEDEYWEHRDSMWREGKILASIIGFGDFRSYNREEKGTFGEKVTMIGYPSADGEGTVIWPDMQLAMSAKSKNKEGAWAFLRTFLTDEYQEENITYAFPLSIKRLDELGEEATKRPFYMEDDKKVEYDDSYYVNGNEIIIPPMTQQEVDAFKEQLYSITKVRKLDEDLLNIIEEEAAPYFTGQKKAEDVAAVIQSRVQIYVNENR